ncbi:GNAT family N-acetyltransferase [Flavobacterium sp. HSC-61S13]|uniref:GNAT family N-acetyltransferase n=1 Tax=Flavobacterium sp. HSC-61S13 TaxID=2910963 RepID=UPI0020A08778|nr:GNAT family N-acetyltransferase [Flavobacterium sp. HSC-61S13]MCP1997250.1 RimJ/RimL family protein N-acetyltransferase/N-acetylglutamate synthase-like GNAT family acetyltransferase [Flavobacterium sp. HSC-61S13]
MSKISRRPATNNDLSFLLHLRKDTMSTYLRESQLDHSESGHLDRIHYAFEYAEIILLHQKPIGLLKTRLEDSILEIIQIQILPEFQKLGIGSQLILNIIRQATLKNLTVHLSVLQVNPALRLYQRLGFLQKAQHNVMIKMEWLPPILETDRFYFRCLTTADANDFYLLNSDPEVIQYTGDSRFETVNQASDFLRQYDQYNLYGVGRCAVIDKTTQQFVGWCGIKYTEETDEYDIGFRFFKKHWNRGYATETARYWLHIAEHVMLIPNLIGRVDHNNKASQYVLEKLGFQKYQEVPKNNSVTLYYKIDF